MPPRVYGAISAVTAELAVSGIAKSQVNAAEQYSFRGIDDIFNKLAPLLAKHRLCILPRVLERSTCERRDAGDNLLISVALKVAFDIVCAEDGSLHTVEAYGEALDGGDKATSKAMSSAFKYAMLQAFCIPVQGAEDSDASTHRLKVSEEQRDPDQGWDQWAFDIQDMIRVCETEEALDRVQATYRGLFRAASKRRPDIFGAIGSIIRARREAVRPQLPLEVPASAPKPAGRRRKANGKAHGEEALHA